VVEKAGYTLALGREDAIAVEMNATHKRSKASNTFHTRVEGLCSMNGSSTQHLIFCCYSGWWGQEAPTRCRSASSIASRARAAASNGRPPCRTHHSRRSAA
jgi:hypothetical protein